MPDSNDDYIKEFKKENPSVSEEDISKLVENLKESEKETSFIQRLSSPSITIGAIIGYAVGSQIPEDALSQIVASVITAAAFEGIIESLPADKEVVEVAAKDVELIYNTAVRTLSPDERREASIYRIAMRNPNLMKLIV